MRTVTCIFLLAISLSSVALAVSSVPQDTLEALFTSRGPFTQKPLLDDAVVVTDDTTGVTASVLLGPDGKVWGVNVARNTLPQKPSLPRAKAEQRAKDVFKVLLPTGFALDKVEFAASDTADGLEVRLVEPQNSSALSGSCYAELSIGPGGIVTNYLLRGVTPSNAEREAAEAVPKISADEAGRLALDAWYKELVRLYGGDESTLRARFIYEASVGDALRFVPAGPGGAAHNGWHVDLWLRKAPVREPDESMGPRYDAHVETGVNAATGEVANFMRFSGPVTSPASPPWAAYSLAAVAALLLVFLVVKLRKR